MTANGLSCQSHKYEFLIVFQFSYYIVFSLFVSLFSRSDQELLYLPFDICRKFTSWSLVLSKLQKYIQIQFYWRWRHYLGYHIQNMETLQLWRFIVILNNSCRWLVELVNYLYMALGNSCRWKGCNGLVMWEGKRREEVSERNGTIGEKESRKTKENLERYSEEGFETIRSGWECGIESKKMEKDHRKFNPYLKGKYWL